MKLEVLPEALADIDRLYDFLVAENPLAAQKAMLAIEEGLVLLEENPQLGSPMAQNPSYRQLFVRFGKSAYVLRYRLAASPDRLFVVRIWHGRERRSES